jgi:hypothetical protein
MTLREERDHYRDRLRDCERELDAVRLGKLQFEIAKLDLKPGDTVVLTAPGMITKNTADRLKAHFERYLPGVKVLVFGDGLNVAKKCTSS